MTARRPLSALLAALLAASPSAPALAAAARGVAAPAAVSAVPVLPSPPAVPSLPAPGRAPSGLQAVSAEIGRAIEAAGEIPRAQPAGAHGSGEAIQAAVLGEPARAASGSTPVLAPSEPGSGGEAPPLPPSTPPSGPQGPQGRGLPLAARSMLALAPVAGILLVGRPLILDKQVLVHSLVDLSYLALVPAAFLKGRFLLSAGAERVMRSVPGASVAALGLAVAGTGLVAGAALPVLAGALTAAGGYAYLRYLRSLADRPLKPREYALAHLAAAAAVAAAGLSLLL